MELSQNTKVNSLVKEPIFFFLYRVGFFAFLSGWVGDFIRYIGNTGNEVNPCLVRDGGVLIEWKSHEELDRWHNDNRTTFPEAAGLLKAMHRAFQLRGDPGVDCPHDAPTLLVTNSGKKIAVLPEHSYSSQLDSFVSSGPSGQFSGNK